MNYARKSDPLPYQAWGFTSMEEYKKACKNYWYLLQRHGLSPNDIKITKKTSSDFYNFHMSVHEKI